MFKVMLQFIQFFIYFFFVYFMHSAQYILLLSFSFFKYINTYKAIEIEFQYRYIYLISYIFKMLHFCCC